MSDHENNPKKSQKKANWAPEKRKRLNSDTCTTPLTPLNSELPDLFPQE